VHLTIKYPLTIVTMALAASLVTGVVAYQISKKELRQAADRQSIEILQDRKTVLGRYLKSTQQDLNLLAANGFVQDAIRHFSSAWQQLDKEQTNTLQRLYIHDNPNKTGEKGDLYNTKDGAQYRVVHSQYHPWLQQFQEKRGYNDIFLLDTTGNLIYSVAKNPDFATNFNSGPWRTTDLGNAFRTTDFNPIPEFQVFYDFKPYEPSNGALVSFISTPVFDSSEKYIGVLAVQLPITQINNIMQNPGSSYKSGRVYLMGQDLIVRSSSSSSLAQPDTQADKLSNIVISALEGRSGAREIINDNGTRVLATYSAISFGGQAWAIISEIDLTEILAPVDRMREVLILSGLAIGLVVSIIGTWFAARLSRPIVAMTRTMQRLAERDLTVEVPVRTGNDELGDMAETLGVFKETAQQRKRAEDEVIRNREILQALADNVPEFISLKDTDLRFIFVNRRFEEWVQIRREDIIGKTVFDIYGAKQAASFDAQDRHIIAAGTVTSQELDLSYPDGQTRSVISTRFPVVGDNGELFGLGTINLNISERKESERALAKINEELKELSELKNKFLGMAAHDLRNPLGAIRGMSQLIIELELGEQKEKEFISTISKVCDEMLNLLNDLLDVSAIESGEFDLDWELGDIGELLKERVELVSLTADLKGITITTTLESVEQCEFDHTRIGQVIDNLLTNAVKFSPPDTTIETEVHSDGRSVFVVVRDNGQGIPPNEIDRVFTAFEKLSSKPTGGEKSTGLGLAIVKRILDSHNGQINVESTPGVGSTFTFSLPLEAKKEPHSKNI